MVFERLLADHLKLANLALAMAPILAKNRDFLLGVAASERPSENRKLMAILENRAHLVAILRQMGNCGELAVFCKKLANRKYFA